MLNLTFKIACVKTNKSTCDTSSYIQLVVSLSYDKNSATSHFTVTKIGRYLSKFFLTKNVLGIDHTRFRLVDNARDIQILCKQVVSENEII